MTCKARTKIRNNASQTFYFIKFYTFTKKMFTEKKKEINLPYTFFLLGTAYSKFHFCSSMISSSRNPCDFLFQVQRFGSKTALLFEDEKYTFLDLKHKINKVAHASLKTGLKPGDTAALLINNEPTFIWTYLGELYSYNHIRHNTKMH